MDIILPEACLGQISIRIHLRLLEPLEKISHPCSCIGNLQAILMKKPTSLKFMYAIVFVWVLGLREGKTKKKCVNPDRVHYTVWSADLSG